MQLDTRATHKTVCGVSRICVQLLKDGEVVGEFGSYEFAFKSMDALWEQRPQVDRVLEAAYSGE